MCICQTTRQLAAKLNIPKLDLLSHPTDRKVHPDQEKSSHVWRLSKHFPGNSTFQKASCPHLRRVECQAHLPTTVAPSQCPGAARYAFHQHHRRAILSRWGGAEQWRCTFHSVSHPPRRIPSSPYCIYHLPPPRPPHRHLSWAPRRVVEEVMCKVCLLSETRATQLSRQSELDWRYLARKEVSICNWQPLSSAFSACPIIHNPFGPALLSLLSPYQSPQTAINQKPPRLNNWCYAWLRVSTSTTFNYFPTQFLLTKSDTAYKHLVIFILGCATFHRRLTKMMIPTKERVST